MTIRFTSLLGTNIANKETPVYSDDYNDSLNRIGKSAAPIGSI